MPLMVLAGPKRNEAQKTPILRGFGVSAEDHFHIKLGRIFSPSGTGRFVSFAGRVRRAALSSARSSGGGRRMPKAPQAQLYSRRVIVKVHYVKMGGQAYAVQKLHLDYIQRDSAAREGERGQLFGRDEVFTDAEDFHRRGQNDRHQFRVIVSPEDGKDIGDLTAFTRSLMAQMERDLQTELDWVAANHFDTANPHTHIVIRGQRDDSRDLVIPRDYISRGLRTRAEALATLELGPATEIDVAKKLALQTRQERLTSIDRDLLGAAESGVVDLTGHRSDGSDWSQRFKLWRLKHLSRLGLAEKTGRGRWRLDAQLEPTLRRLGERGDILKAYHKTLRAASLDRASFNDPVYDPTHERTAPITGRVIQAGVLDDVNDRTFLVLDTTAGEALYVDTGRQANIEGIKPGQIVTTGPHSFTPKPSDYVITDIAAGRGGIYSPSAHERSDPSARDDYIAAHVRRLEALRRAGHVVRNPDGSWQLPQDYLKRAAAYEKARSFGNPVRLEVASHLPLDDQIKAVGKTWLDGELMDGRVLDAATGFGEAVETAKTQRRAFLLSQGYITPASGVSAATLKQLETLDLDGAGDTLAKRLQKPYVRAPEAGRIAGMYREVVTRPSGKYALIEKSKEFTLVPWRSAMDRNLGKSISGVRKGQTISWTLTKGLGHSRS